MKLLSPKMTHNYKKIVTILNSSSLESHRILNDCTYFYNLINNDIDCTELLSKVAWKIPSLNLRNVNVETYYIPTVKTYFLYHAPLLRICRTVNNFELNLNKPLKSFKQTAKNIILNDFN